MDNNYSKHQLSQFQGLFMCHLFIPHNIAMIEVPSVCAYVLVSQLCLTLCNPMDCSLSVSSIHGILQARILEWVTFPFSRGIFPTQGLNLGLLHCRRMLYCLSHHVLNFILQME